MLDSASMFSDCIVAIIQSLALFFQGFILVLLPALCLTNPIARSETCQDPENFELMLAKYQAEDTLSNILPLPVQQIIENLNRGASFSGTDTTEFEAMRGPDQLLYGNKTCPEALSAEHVRLEDRSTCPYYYVISNDPLRYPVAIAEARCKCMRCFDDSTGDNLCEPIYFPKTVLRRQNECINGIYQYKPETNYIQNGCVCAKRRFLVTSSSEASSTNQQSSSSTDHDHSDSQPDVNADQDDQNAAITPRVTPTSLPFTFH